MKAKVQVVTIVDGILTAFYPSISKKVTIDLNKVEKTFPMLGVLAKWHGWKQKFVDVKAGESPQEKYEHACRLRDSLLAGNWEISREVDTTSIVIEAVERIKGMKQGQITREFDQKKISEERRKEMCTKWRANAQVKAMIATIYKERADAAAAESTDTLMVNIS